MRAALLAVCLATLSASVCAEASIELGRSSSEARASRFRIASVDSHGNARLIGRTARTGKFVAYYDKIARSARKPVRRNAG